MRRKIATMVRSTMPTREQMERNRFTGPLAARAELWRFNRRSVPRGVAIGLLVGIFAMIRACRLPVRRRCACRFAATFRLQRA
jgi:hypothetical protein